MACYYPLSGWKSQSGGFTLKRENAFIDLPMSVPCGGCVGCRLRRAGEWAIRGTHEASLYDANVFITLTYDDKRLPPREYYELPANVGLHYPDFQSFMGRLRDRFSYIGFDGVNPIRFIVAGEYGDQLGRPHFHAILFNFRFPDQKFWYRSKQGHVVTRSAILEELWPWGHSDIGTVTPSSIAYVSRYVMKKVTGRDKIDHYKHVDSDGVIFTHPDTGKIIYREPEFARYSLKPGIGADWFSRFHSSVYPHDYVIFNGNKVRPPRYYDKLYKQMTGVSIAREVTLNARPDTVIDFDIEVFSQHFEDLKALRVESAKKYLDDNTPSRLAVREQVALAKVSRLPRKLT